MKKSFAGRHSVVALLGLAACAVVAVLAILLSSGSESSGAADVEPDPEFSVLAPASSEAKAALAENAQNWLREQGQSSLPGIAKEPLVAVGSASTNLGEVAVAQFGHNLCIYAVERGISSCGERKLIDEGKLLVVFPSCDGVEVFGLLADGSEPVEVKADGKAAGSDVIAVESNVYAAKVSGSDLVLEGSSGKGEPFVTQLPIGEVPAC